MNIDRLIDRIEKALREDTTTDPVYHALAKEYAKYRTQIDERLEHCVTLIRSGKDFAARELAEQPPDVLTLMEKLSFANDAKWRSLCEERDLYIGPNWAEEHVDLLNGLYDKEITEDSPLFREYRTAARSRDEDKTFKILKMILKANPDHGAARRHFGQLSVKIQENKINELDSLIQANREAEFLDLMLEIDDTDWVVRPKGDKWENALAVREGVERRIAKGRLEKILVELASFRAADDWKGSLALIGEFFNLAQEHGLEGELDADDINLYNEYKEWADELAEDAKAERELEGVVSRFKNRLAEMRQSDTVGGKSLEVYLEEQNELRKFSQDFQDLGKSLSAEIMMELQKAENHVKNRILKLRGRTKRLWMVGVFAFVLVAAVSVAGLWWLSGFWDARSAAEKIATDTLTPTQQWEKLSAYSADYGNYLTDDEVRKSLDQAIASAFDGAGDNLVQESQDEFLLKTQDKELKFLSKAEVERKRAQVVAKMCDRILEQMKGDDFDVGDGKDFVEMFEDTPRVRKDEKGNPMPLQEVDYSRFTENKFILDKLQEISASLARMEDSNERKQQSLEELQAKIARFDKEVLIAWKKFRDTGEVDHGILAQENYLDGLDSESREFSGDEAIDPNDYREIRSALRELRSTWRSFSKEVESKSQKPTPSQPALNPSLDYYNHLKKVLENPLISDMWSYQLLECTPLKTDRPGVYETNRKPLMQLFSYGVVAEKKSQKNFDRFGQPIANPSVTVTQTGMFHWEGKKEGRAFDSTHFNGGIKGFMLDNPQLSATSVFAKRLMSESLNHQTGTLAISLATLVNKIYLEKSINPTLKAYLHMEVVTMMKAKGDTSSPDHLKILQNFDKIDAGLKSRLSPSLWIDLP